MFSKLALFAATFAVFVAALPSPGGPSVVNSCDDSQTYCCNSYQTTTSQAAQDKSGVGVLIPAGVTAGLTCNPISIAAIQSNECTTQSSCCTGNSFKGGVVFGCSPLNVNPL